MGEFWRWMKEKISEERKKGSGTAEEEVNEKLDEVDKRRSSINGDQDPFGF